VKRYVITVDGTPPIYVQRGTVQALLVWTPYQDMARTFLRQSDAAHWLRIAREVDEAARIVPVEG
jgi:hypothetical protein